MPLEELAAKHFSLRPIYEGLQQTAAEFGKGREQMRKAAPEALEIAKEGSLDP